MAITSLEFANRVMVTLKNKVKKKSMLIYKSDGEALTDFVGDRIVLGCPTGITIVRDLCTLGNGIKYRIELTHRADPVDGGYRHYYDGVFHVLDEYDNELSTNMGCQYIRSPYSISFGPPYFFSPYYDYPVFSEIYYFYSAVYYDTGYYSPDTIAGDPAYMIYPFGMLWYRLNTTVDLSGYKKQSEIGVNATFFSLMPSIYDETELNNFLSDIVAKGDGSDPFDIKTPQDPYDPSGPGGGDNPGYGGREDGGDVVDFPGLPTISALNTGLLSIYNPTSAQLRSLASKLWSNDFVQSISKILNDPFDGIIGLSMVPFAPITSGSAMCKLGNYNTEVEMPLISSQYKIIDCGYIDVTEAWKNALDYSPYTKISIFLPFVGIKTLKTEDIMNRRISVKYNIDVLTGSGIAFIKCGDRVIYNFPCKVSYDIPLTGSNKASLYTGLIGIVTSAAGGATAGGALGAAGGAATSAINTMTSKQSDISRSGSISSNTGILGDFIPYIIINRPVQSMPARFKEIKGYQSNISSDLGSIHGYTEVDFINLENIDGTDEELEEIKRLLKDGVII